MTAVDKDFYRPRKETQDILDRGRAMVESVPYHVSARWVFYRLFQEGLYQSKADYDNKWLKVVSRARHAMYRGWRPDTLADETRSAIHRGHGYRTSKVWLENYADRIQVNLNKWYDQDNYVELWFEARAMTDQFRHYTEHLTLRPMGGQPSIPYKWEAAKEIESFAQRYDSNVIILYFGDLDDGGETIERVTRDDVQKWCSVDFQFVRCGLNLGQPEQFGLPENPDKPGQYQWEALPDEAAEEIITGNVNDWVDLDAFDHVEEREDYATTEVRNGLAQLAEDWIGYDE